MAEGAPASDEDLVRLVLGGDAAAATLLFNRHLAAHRGAVRRRLLPVVRGKLGESDVIQDAYLAAFQHLHEFEDRGHGSFAHWLRRIVERKISNGIRGQVVAGKRDARREVRLATGQFEAVSSKRQRTPSATAMVKEQARAVRASVEALPEDYRIVVKLVHHDSMSLVEAAARMGRSPDAARKLYGRAMALLAERMRDAGQRSG